MNSFICYIVTEIPHRVAFLLFLVVPPWPSPAMASFVSMFRRVLLFYILFTNTNKPAYSGSPGKAVTLL